jgi:hypothetical protein
MSLDTLISIVQKEAAAKVREEGKNAGARVEAYQKSVSLGKGDPWCAAFVSWSVTQALGRTVAPKWCSGSAVSLYHAARKKLSGEFIATPDEWKKVKAGWVWVRSDSDENAKLALKGSWSKGHTGIVILPSEKNFKTVEGNTNAAGSREGDGVYEKIQSWTDGRTVGFFDPMELTRAWEGGAKPVVAAIVTSPPPAAKVRIVTTSDSLSIRQSPSTTGDVAGKLAKNSVVEIDAQATGSPVDGNSVWYRLSDKRGWISAKFATPENVC